MFVYFGREQAYTCVFKEIANGEIHLGCSRTADVVWKTEGVGSRW